MKKRAFTLIEVIVSVMIISVVIASLLQMYANNNFIFTALKKNVTTNQYMTLLASNSQYGFESKHVSLYDLAQEFDLESDLRRKLKDIPIDILYKEQSSIDLSEDENASESQIVLEIGKMTMQGKNFSNNLLRLKIR
jgi:prepilin-type N-terminal cleavage/methylation domain-containing protein